MKIKAYLYFPDTDVAIQNLNASPDSYTGIIKELYAVKYKLKKNSEYEICYDSANVSSFLAVAKDIVSAPYLTGISNQLHAIIGTKSKNVNLPKLRNHQFLYVNWTIVSGGSVVTSPFVIAESAEDSLKDSVKEKTICICLGNSLNTERGELHIIKDAVHVSSLPILINISATNSDVGFVNWVTTLPTDSFRLKGNPDFEPLAKFWKKERIYKHKVSGNHWYFDFNHKDNKVHYELFDATGDTHLGEADVKGEIKPDTSNNEKKISNIL